MNSVARMVVPNSSSKQEAIASASDARSATSAKRLFATDDEIESKNKYGPTDDEEVFFALRSQKKIALEMEEKKELVGNIELSQ